MPQPNMQQMLKQVQKMQQDMMAAQEQLKDEVVEASAGGGMVTVKVTGDLEVKEVTIDPAAVDPEDVELLQDMVLAAVNEAVRQAQELAARKMGGVDRRPRRPRRAARRARAARACERLYAPPDPAARHRARQAARHRRSAPRSASPSTSCAPSREDADALADAIREVKERIGLCEVCFNLADGPRCRICAGRAPRPRASSASSRSPATSSRSSARTSSAAATTCSAARCRRSTASTPRTCKIAELYARVERADAPVREVVLATNPTTTGEATALHIADALRERSPDVTVTRLASGLPVGADLEYADEVTLGRALRRPPRALISRCDAQRRGRRDVQQRVGQAARGRDRLRRPLGTRAGRPGRRRRRG